jgi:hypothetical protein
MKDGVSGTGSERVCGQQRLLVRQTPRRLPAGDDQAQRKLEVTPLLLVSE